MVHRRVLCFILWLNLLSSCCCHKQYVLYICLILWVVHSKELKITSNEWKVCNEWMCESLQSMLQLPLFQSTCTSTSTPLFIYVFAKSHYPSDDIFPFNYFLRGRASDVVSETDGWVIVVGRGPQWKEWVAGENMNTLLIKDTVRLDKTVTLCPAARPERLFVNIAFSFIHRRTKIGHMCLQSAHVGPACEASTNWVTSCWLDVHMSGEN